MKINSPHFSHKSDLGAVLLNIRTQADAERAFRNSPPWGVKNRSSCPVDGHSVKGGHSGRQSAIKSFGPLLSFGSRGHFCGGLERRGLASAPLSL